MQDTSKGRIFLAANRGHTETEGFRSYNTFNSGNYKNEAGAPFGALYLCNDDTLGGGRSNTLSVEKDTLLLVIPLVGAVVFEDSAGRKMVTEAGSFLQVAVPPGTTVSIRNPYEDQLVNFLHIAMTNPRMGAVFHKGHIDLDAAPDDLSLLQLAHHSSESPLSKLAIGKFNGRAEVRYDVAADNGVFLFVVQGAFEAQFRLLESRDALAIWNTTSVEIEALSNEAILLLLEVRISSSS